MNPKYLHIQDFMSHKETEIDFDKFQVALVLGCDNSDPRVSNGVGKSVIFHAIRYALFGEAPTTVLEKIIRESSKEAKVTFIFEMNGNEYRIIRSRTKSNVRVELSQKFNGVWSSKGKKDQKTSTETHKEILKLIGMTDDAFSHANLFSQNDLYGLASAKTKEERREILKGALNLKSYKKLEEMVKKVITAINKKIAVRKGIIEALGEPENDVANIEATLETCTQLVKSLEKQVEENKISLKSKRSEFSQLQRLVNADVVTAQDKLSSLVDQKNAKKKSIKNAQEEINENLAKISSLQNTISDLQDDLIALEKKKTALMNRPMKQLTKVMSDLEKTRQNELNGKAYVGSLHSKADELREPIPDDQECPTCHQELTEEYRQKYQEDALKKLRALEADIADKSKKLNAVTQKRSRLEAAIDDINAFSRNLSLLNNEIQAKQNEVNSNQQFVSRLIKLNSTKEEELNLLKVSLGKDESLEKSLRDTLKSLSKNDVSDKVIAVKQEIEHLEELLDKDSAKLSKAHKESGTLSANLATRQKDVRKINNERARLTSLIEDLNKHKKVREAFSSGGIPTLIIHTILDDLQIESNNFLATLKPGLELQFNKDLELFFYINGREREYRQLSGGQQMDFAFSLKMGLSLIIQRRLGVETKMILLDEVDQSLDEATVDNYAEIVKKLQKDFKVLVITHNNRLKDKFNCAIMVEGDSIKGATSSFISW